MSRNSQEDRPGFVYYVPATSCYGIETEPTERHYEVSRL